MKSLSQDPDEIKSRSWKVVAQVLRLQECNNERCELLEEKVLLAIKVKNNEATHLAGRRWIRMNCELRYWTAESAKVEGINTARPGKNEMFISSILREFEEDFDSGN